MQHREGAFSGYQFLGCLGLYELTTKLDFRNLTSHSITYILEKLIAIAPVPSKAVH